MKRRGFLKAILGGVGALALTPLVKATESKRKPVELSEADKWRKMCGYGDKPEGTLSMKFLPNDGDIVSVGNDDLFVALPEGVAERIHAEHKAKASKDIESVAHSTSFLNRERSQRLEPGTYTFDYKGKAMQVTVPNGETP